MLAATKNVPLAAIVEELKLETSITFSLREKIESCTVKAVLDVPARDADAKQVLELFTIMVLRNAAANEMSVGTSTSERR